MRKPVLLIGLLLITFHASAYDFVAKNVYYTILSANEVAVSKGENNYSKRVFIPERVTNSSVTYTVTEIEKDAFSGCVSLTDVVLPNTVKKINENAFSMCFSLKNFSIPPSTEYIGASAFNMCPGPDTIRVPETTTHIGKNAFSGNENLKWIEAAHFNRNYTSADGVLFNSAQTEIIAFPAGRESRYEIPPTITAIEESIFANSKITSVKIPYSVISIGKQAFWYCDNMQTIEIPPSVISIGEQAFAHCAALKEINIPASVQHIEKEAFLQCVSLKTIDIPASIFAVNERTFAYCTSLEKVNIKSATVRVIDKLAFSYCINLKELTLPSTVFYVGHGAFYPCKKLSIIRAHHVNPLKINGYVFSDVDKSKCKVYVPANSVEKYKQSPEWKDFKNFVPTNYRFTLSFSQPQKGTLKLLTDSTAIESGKEFNQSTEFIPSLTCEEGYELDKFIINGIIFDVLPPAFLLMDDTKIEVKLRRSPVIRERPFELAAAKSIVAGNG